MANGNVLESLLGQPSNGRTGSFYKPINRTDDLISSTNLRGSQGVRPPELYIAPPSAQLGTLPTRLITELDGLLVFKAPPPPEDVARSEIGELVARFGGGDPRARSTLLRELEQKKLTGEITAAARRLNEARLSPVERALLSHNNIALYSLYRAAVGMQVSDVDGITSNALSSLDKVKSYVNRKLVSEVLDRENLARTTAELTQLQNRLAERNLSYREGEAERLIVAEYRQVKGRASIIAACEEFLSRGVVSVPSGLDRHLLVKRMIAYLDEQGFNAAAVPGLTASFRARMTGLRVQLEDASVDDGRVVDWRWTFGDGGSSNQQNPVHEYLSPGAYTVELTIADNDGNRASFSDSILVERVVRAPSPSLKVQYLVKPLSTGSKLARVDFRAVLVAGARIKESQWDFGDGASRKANEETTHEYTAAGPYTVKVTTTDEDGKSATATEVIEISAPWPPQGPYFIAGQAVDSTGNPVPNKLVAVFFKDANGQEHRLSSTRTKANGAFEIRYSDHEIQQAPSKTPPQEVIVRIGDEKGQELLNQTFLNVGPQHDLGSLKLNATRATGRTLVKGS